MGKKLQRIFRDRRLTPQEAAVDRDLRTKLQAEFPAADAMTRPQPSSLSELLAQSIRDSGKSVDVIAGESGVPAALIAGFLSGQRDIHLATADKLARTLGLEVTAD